MSRYLLIRRLRGPAFLLLVGMNALLAQAHILGWGKSWPFYLILAGILLLAERAALAMEGYPPFSCAPWQGMSQTAPNQGAANSAANTGTSIVPSHDFENDREGGQQ